MELSFQDPESGGVTDLSTLRVAQLSNGVWMDAGALSNTGQFGLMGSVVGNFINPMQASEIFTLGSSINLENPLPVKLLDFRAAAENDSAVLHWKIDGSEDATYFEVQQAIREMEFEHSTQIPALQNKTDYRFATPWLTPGAHYFRLKVQEKNGNAFFSRTVKVENSTKNGFQFSIFPTLIESGATITARSSWDGDLMMRVVDMSGRTVRSFSFALHAGEDFFSLDLAGLSAGMYVLMGSTPHKELFRARIVKK